MEEDFSFLPVAVVPTNYYQTRQTSRNLSKANRFREEAMCPINNIIFMPPRLVTLRSLCWETMSFKLASLMQKCCFFICIVTNKHIFHDLYRHTVRSHFHVMRAYTHCNLLTAPLAPTLQKGKNREQKNHAAEFH